MQDAISRASLPPSSCGSGFVAVHLLPFGPAPYQDLAPSPLSWLFLVLPTVRRPRFEPFSLNVLHIGDPRAIVLGRMTFTCHIDLRRDSAGLAKETQR